FWALLVLIAAGAAAGARLSDAPQSAWSAGARTAFGLSLILLPLVHFAVLRSASPAALPLNAAMAAGGLAVLVHSAWAALRTGVRPVRLGEA
ncbi:hypothetical protein ABS198_20620, partial [Acinetobacter baumannii]